jgi:23S rRNA (pseudouridine1915-N3)-methyltransferase
MLLHVIARGRIGRTSEAELVERYLKRIAWPTRVTELPERGGTVPAGLSPSRTVLLDERGQQLSSEAFAALLGRWRDDGVREVRFLIGAADGHGDAARADAGRPGSKGGGADLLLGFGAMTWPHMLARAMLAEQLWRASSILAGHPYHRSG